MKHPLRLSARDVSTLRFLIKQNRILGPIVKVRERNFRLTPSQPPARFASSPEVRVLPAVVLPGPIHLRGGRLSRIAARQAGPEKRPQVHRQNYAVCSRAASGAAGIEFQSSGGMLKQNFGLQVRLRSIEGNCCGQKKLMQMPQALITPAARAVNDS